MKRPLLALLTAAMAAISAPALALDIGLNIHGGGGSATANGQIATVMQQRNLKNARMDLIYNQNLTNFRDQVNKINANGGRVEAVTMISYQWDNSCNSNLAYVEQDAYNQTAALVNQVKDIVHDFELMNEVQLRPEITKEVPWNTAGTSTTPYQGKPCVATLTAVLRGMSRAIRDIRTSSGLPLRVILGEVGRDFGFLTFEQQNGVVWDVTGFHNYPHYSTASMLSDTWYGPGGPLAQLASFGRPVHLNEFNCGEIYDAGYENQAGAAVTETCLKAFNKHSMDLRNQTIANLESVHVYELLDEPSKAVPENRFGLMYNLTSPKVHLYLATAYAGGTLSSQERYEITSRGLLTDAQITAMQAAAPAPAPTPESTQGSSITSSGSLVDATGATWTVSGGVIYRNGAATVSSSVTLLLYWNHTIYQQNSYGGWWDWVNGGWQATTDPRVASAPTPTPTESAQGASITTSGTIVDATGATWTVSGGVIYRNGTATVSSSVTLLLYWNHTVYQQNSYGGWWCWVSGGWQATTDPRVATTTPTPIADTQAPVVSITSPANGSSFRRGSAVSVNATATDNVAVKQVSFSLNGSTTCVSNTAPYQCQIRLPNTRGWTGTVQVQATDTSGNVASQSIRVSTQ